jgi:hypothetical protein
MTRILAASLALGLVLVAGGPAIAHHAISAEFDTTKTITFSGTVKKVDWMNPHIYTHVEVKEADGKIIVYKVEGGAPNALFRNGWRMDSLKPGTVINFSGRPAKLPGSTNVNGSMTTAEGVRPFAGQGPANQFEFSACVVCVDPDVVFGKVAGPDAGLAFPGV